MEKYARLVALSILFMPLLCAMWLQACFAGQCHGKRALLLLSDSFKPYEQAADIIMKELLRNCPGIKFVKRVIGEKSWWHRDNDEELPSVVFPIGTGALLQSQEDYPGVPKVFSMVLDPPKQAISGSETYGVSLNIDYMKEMKVLIRIIPSVKTIGCLYSRDTKGVVKELENTADKLGLRLLAIKIDSIDALEESLQELFENSDALLAVPDTLIYNNIIAPRIIYSAIRYQRPFVGLSRKFTASGALMSIDCDYLESVRRAAQIGLDLMHGRHPENAFEHCSRFTVYFNLRTARLLGLDVSEEELQKFSIISD